jgi:hypothetical protein
MSRTGKISGPHIVQDSQIVSHLGKSLQTKVPAPGDLQTNQNLRRFAETVMPGFGAG